MFNLKHYPPLQLRTVSNRHKRRLIANFVLLVVLLLSTVLSQQQPVHAQTAGFVRHSGTRFVLNGSPFYVAGTNNYYPIYKSTFMVDDFLQAAQNQGLNVIRIWAMLDIGSLDGSMPHVDNGAKDGVYFQYWDTATRKPAYNDGATGLQKLDYVIKRAGDFNLKVIPVLINNWSAFGGMDQYVQWYSLTYHDEFYTNANTQQAYKNWVSHVINRTNSISGIQYKNDPNIFAWELANEPRCKGSGQKPYSTSCTPATVTNWVSIMSSYIKSLDANHMVSVGDEGFFNRPGSSHWTYNGTEGGDFEAFLRLSTIDFGTYHLYAQDWGVDPNTWVPTWITDHISAGNTIGKPVILEEFGYKTPSQAEAFYNTWTNAVCSNNGAGWIYWILTGRQDDGTWYPDYDSYNVNSTMPIYNTLRTAALKMTSHSCNLISPTATFTRTITATATRTSSPVPPTVTPLPGSATSVDDSVMGAGQNQFNYVGSWSHCTNCNETAPATFYNASQTWGSTTNDTVTIAFTGVQIKYYAITAPHHGIVAVSIDGGAETNVDLYSTAKTGNVLKWVSPALASGNHTLKLRITGAKNASSSGTVVTLDRVEITTSSTSPTATRTNTPGGPTATRTRTPLPVTATRTPTRTNTSVVPTNTAVSATATRTATNVPTTPPNTGGFAYRCGIHFCKDGKLFYFAGTNTYDIFTFGDGGSTQSPEAIENAFMDKARIDTHFARLQQDGVQVVRLWMFSHENWHGFEPAKGVYSEPQFMLFDYIIESAKTHNVMLMPVFENYWEAYGGIDTRLSWEGVSGGHPGRWRFFNKSICPGCFTSYKNYVSYALNRVNHYSGLRYKDEKIIFAWDLMNEPRYQDATPNENSTGTTLRAWVDEMASFVKSIDPNHMVGVGLEAHEVRYNFGGDEGNPFIYIHQSPYIDMTSAHPYPTEAWANLSIVQTQALIRTWITESHNIVGKPFYLGEFNTHTGDRSQWWSAIFGEFEANNGDGTGFWWYQDRGIDGKFGVLQGSPELAVFRQHSANQRAKNVSAGPSPTPCTSCPTATRTSTPLPATATRTPTRTSTPGAGPSVHVEAKAGTNTSQETQYQIRLFNDSIQAQSGLKVRVFFDLTEVYNAGLTFSNVVVEEFFDQCGTTPGAITAWDATRRLYYVDLSWSAAINAGANCEAQIRVRLSGWQNVWNGSNDYSIQGLNSSTFARTTFIPAYQNGSLIYGSQP